MEVSRVEKMMKTTRLLDITRTII